MSFPEAEVAAAAQDPEMRSKLLVDIMDALDKFSLPPDPWMSNILCKFAGGNHCAGPGHPQQAAGGHMNVPDNFSLRFFISFHSAPFAGGSGGSEPGDARQAAGGHDERALQARVNSCAGVSQL